MYHKSMENLMGTSVDVQTDEISNIGVLDVHRCHRCLTRPGLKVWRASPGREGLGLGLLTACEDTSLETLAGTIGENP